MRNPPLLSRRQFAAGVAAAVPAASGLAHPILGEGPLTPTELLDVWARLYGPLDGTVSYASFDGTMAAIAPSGAAESLCRYRGVLACRVRALASGKGWRIEQRELSSAYAPSEADGFTNPISGARVMPVPAAWSTATWEIDAATAAGLAWSEHGATMSLDQPFRVRHDGGMGETPGEGAWRESLSFTFARDQIAHGGRTAAIRTGGTMLRTMAWPAWLGMGRSPGHVLCQARCVAGLSAPGELPSDAQAAFGDVIGVLRRFA